MVSVVSIGNVSYVLTVSLLVSQCYDIIAKATESFVGLGHGRYSMVCWLACDGWIAFPDIEVGVVLRRLYPPISGPGTWT